MTNKYIADKPLREYTAGEIHDICGGIENCCTCPFMQKDGWCPFDDRSPNLWRLNNERRLTERELAICRSVGARYVTRDNTGNNNFVTLWDRKPNLWGGTIYGVDGPVGSLALVEDRSGLFRSVKPGECIEVEGVSGDD